MQDSILIRDNVWWIGSNDRTTHLFESLWPIPEGVCYNTYLVRAGKTVLIDTLKAPYTGEFIKKIQALLEGRKLDYLVVNHMEPDHSGSIRLVREIWPEVTIIGNKTTFDMMANFYGITGNTHTVKDGDTLDIGGKTLRFYLTPMLHWPETMMTFDEKEGILFSGDAFGGFGAMDGGIFDDEVNTCYADNEIMRYYTNIVGKYGAMVQTALKKLAGLPVQIICATHGPIWRTKPAHIISMYDKWSRQEPDRGVLVIYASMYGNTEQLADRAARVLVEKGVGPVEVMNASTTHISYLINETWKYKGVILAAPTYNLSLFPLMKNYLEAMEEYGVKDKVVGLLSSFTWSGGGMKRMKETVERLKWDLVEPAVEVKSAPRPEDLELVTQMAAAMAAKLAAYTYRAPAC